MDQNDLTLLRLANTNTNI